MRIEVLADAERVASRAADFIAAEARAAVAARGRFVFAVSGGRTPWLMMRYLVDRAVPWDRTYVLQVDERVAPAGHPDRNLTHLHENLLEHSRGPHPGSVSRLPPDRLHPMPVAEADLAAAASRYAQKMREIAGSPPILDLVHLGLGADGHTASLLPGDPVLDIDDADVAVTGVYEGRRRMTLTYPVINRSRRILWLVTGDEKAPMLARLREADPSIPAGRVEQRQALVLADRLAAESLDTGAE
jgi:6-phosphogluconolactonase